MNRKHYNESDRLALLREYYSSGLSKYAFIKKHNLSGSAILNKWIKKIFISPKRVTFGNESAKEIIFRRRNRNGKS